ncbi:citrate synthase-lysine N-methyltransferase CSKMT, mitochondrial isoform X3 [Octopus bimaculoides]|uniref:citrate synthase-lysine N-methyltransferase CSKMT, mitochondrial isoform X3 n=1 Tax=Octopus bimaculoides TaxID=37653 RepID=UPI0022DFF471|nr:citrate synthase-lysine N-methyltransferase CSKMT, mitochondrial isoform X3 [Octopus bimaculoides]
MLLSPFIHVIVTRKTRTHSQGEALSKLKYWKYHYKKNLREQNEFDWLLNSETVSNSVLNQLAIVQGNTILDLGCGMSSVSQKLLKKSQHPIFVHSLDYVASVIEHQKKLHSVVPKGNLSSGFDCIIADACLLPYKDKVFDIVVDKGTMDSLLKDDIKERRMQKFACLLEESLRILRPGGCFMQFTDEDPDIHYDILFIAIQKHSAHQYQLSFTSAGSEPYPCYVYLIKKIML